jgi:hypothetical protein
MAPTLSKGMACAGALCASVALATPASAFVVNVGGQNYDVKTVFGTFAANQTLLESQQWWNDSTLAEDFAAAINSQLGSGNAGIWGPFFAYETTSPGPDDPSIYNPDYLVSAKTWQASTSSVVGISTVGASYTPPGSAGPITLEWNYAYVERAPSTSVPGPLPLFGAVAAFGWSRRLRKRIAVN